MVTQGVRRCLVRRQPGVAGRSVEPGGPSAGPGRPRMAAPMAAPARGFPGSGGVLSRVITRFTGWRGARPLPSIGRSWPPPPGPSLLRPKRRPTRASASMGAAAPHGTRR